MGPAISDTGGGWPVPASYVREGACFELPDLHNAEKWRTLVYNFRPRGTDVVVKDYIDVSQILAVFSNTSPVGLAYTRGATATPIITETPREQIFELRQLLGVSLEEVGGLLKTDRRTLYNWVNGRKPHRHKIEKLGRILSVVRYFDQGIAEENRAILYGSTFDGTTVAELLKHGDYDTAMNLVPHGVGSRDRGWAPVSAKLVSTFGPTTLDSLKPEVIDAGDVEMKPTRAGSVRRIPRRA